MCGWHMPVILPLGRWGQRDVLGAQGHPGPHSKASLGLHETLSQKSKTNKTLKLKTRDWQDSFS